MLSKLEDFLSDFPVGNSNDRFCHADVVPLEETRNEEKFVTCQNVQFHPRWYGKFVWLGDPPYARTLVKNPSELAKGHMINGNPQNLDIEKLTNVPGKYFKRKRWRCRNGLGFVRFIYEGQVAVSRICGRDFFINGQPGSLPHLVANEEIDITMEVRRLKKPGLWPQFDRVNVDNLDDLITTEFVSPAAWTGARPVEDMLEKHVEKAALDMFR